MEDTLSIPLDTVYGIVLSVLGTAWVALAGFMGWFHGRLQRVEQRHVTRDEFVKLMRSVSTIKRIVFLLADKAGIENGALHEDDA